MLFSLSCNKQQDIIKDYTHKTNNCRHSPQLRHDWPHYTSDISAGYLIFCCPQSPAPGHCTVLIRRLMRLDSRKRIFWVSFLQNTLHVTTRTLKLEVQIMSQLYLHQNPRVTKKVTVQTWYVTIKTKHIISKRAYKICLYLRFANHDHMKWQENRAEVDVKIQFMCIQCCVTHFFCCSIWY